MSKNRNYLSTLHDVCFTFSPAQTALVDRALFEKQYPNEEEIKNAVEFDAVWDVILEVVSQVKLNRRGTTK